MAIKKTNKLQKAHILQVIFSDQNSLILETKKENIVSQTVTT